MPRLQGKARRITLAHIKAKLRQNPNSLTVEEMKAIHAFQKLAQDRSPNVVPLPAARFDLAKELAKILPMVFQGLVHEATAGKGISRIMALRALKEWAGEQTAPRAEATKITFNPIGEGVGEESA